MSRTEGEHYFAPFSDLGTCRRHVTSPRGRRRRRRRSYDQPTDHELSRAIISNKTWRLCARHERASCPLLRVRASYRHLSTSSITPAPLTFAARCAYAFSMHRWCISLVRRSSRKSNENRRWNSEAHRFAFVLTMQKGCSDVKAIVEQTTRSFRTKRMEKKRRIAKRKNLNF